MRGLLFSPLLFISALMASPSNITLDLFSNAAFINKSFELQETGKLEVLVPKTINIEDIRQTLSKNCSIQKQTLSEVKKNENEELTNLIEKRENLTYEISATQSQNALLKTLSLENIKEMDKITTLSQLLKKGLIENAKKVASLKEELTQVEKKISVFPQKTFKYLQIDYTCKNEEGALSLRYPQNASYKTFHTLQAKPNDKAININTQAKISYKEGENFDNVDINFYSYAYNANTAPRKFYPNYLSKKNPKPLMEASKRVMADGASATLSTNVTHDETATKSHYSIKGVKLSTVETKFLELDSQTLDAKFTNYIDAYGTNRAYTQVTFTPKKQYQAATNTLLLENTMIAKKYFPTFKKGEETELYFGENEHINVEKELIKTLAEKTFFGDKRIDTQNWKYTITNTTEYAQDIRFVTRTPVSKDANIVVKTTAQPDFDTKTATGKTLWNFTLEANASKEIIFGYEISEEDD